MSILNSSENVKSQYSDDKNLTARINLHSKYSTNKTGLVSWLFDIYDFSGAERILELGCGTGAQWEGRADSLPNACRLILSDFSEGMVNVVEDKYKEHKNTSVERIDIQSIPYPDESFDIVIANYMLYHVPDLDKALCEVRRVLKSSGTFYAATTGNGGMRSYLHNIFKQVNPALKLFNEDLSFSMQNGNEILVKYFTDVTRLDYEDSFSITDTQELIDYIRSTMTITGIAENDLSGLYTYLESIRLKEGSIKIPKENCVFISRK